MSRNLWWGRRTLSEPGDTTYHCHLHKLHKGFTVKLSVLLVYLVHLAIIWSGWWSNPPVMSSDHGICYNHSNSPWWASHFAELLWVLGTFDVKPREKFIHLSSLRTATSPETSTQNFQMQSLLFLELSGKLMPRPVNSIHCICSPHIRDFNDCMPHVMTSWPWAGPGSASSPDLVLTFHRSIQIFSGRKRKSEMFHEIFETLSSQVRSLQRNSKNYITFYIFSLTLG